MDGIVFSMQNNRPVSDMNTNSFTITDKRIATKQFYKPDLVQQLK